VTDIRGIALLGAFFLLPATTLGNGDLSKPGPNGGKLADAGKYHLELVIRPAELRVYVTAAKDAKVDTQGAEASATVLAAREKSTLKLVPAGGNALAASGRFDPKAAMTVVVTLTLAKQAPVQARFAIKP
jgi:hypothetical protein